MSNWFLKNLDGSDIAKMLGRTFDLEITELNYHYFDEEDQQYVIFSAISNNKEPNLSLMGTVFKDHVSFSYRGKKADAGVFEALKYRVFKRINSNKSNLSTKNKTLDDYFHHLQKKYNYAGFIHKKNQMNKTFETTNYIQKTL